MERSSLISFWNSTKNSTKEFNICQILFSSVHISARAVFASIGLYYTARMARWSFYVIITTQSNRYTIIGIVMPMQLSRRLHIDHFDSVAVVSILHQH